MIVFDYTDVYRCNLIYGGIKMSVQLLDKTRKINKLLHNNHSARVEFNDMCAVLSGILESNILVISRKVKSLALDTMRVLSNQ